MYKATTLRSSNTSHVGFETNYLVSFFLSLSQILDWHFDTFVLLYRVEVWGNVILESNWKEFKNARYTFLMKFLHVKISTSCMLFLRETISLLIELMSNERVGEYTIKVKLDFQIPKLYLQVSELS